ncbi:helix-turn-helix domain-containing protein [Citrobacter amalonaticus]|uniref:helix-turn-helix domain-containing protein n=1 Tax=Citrobacter amalonaticus TaxID=35703 RepID=UPI0004D470CA|nr:helix-turn-helix domain-containing protein [Citrobacter amalonaticus]KEY49031.1 hypothetical protein DQ02_09545 [Citrobacter amalonaticus]
MQNIIITDLIAWIEENIIPALSLDDIAGKSGYSKWYLQRIFKKITGLSIGQYVRERRLSEAAKDLLSSHDTILTIALKYGFESQPTFTRAFRKKFGHAPGQFRKMSVDNHNEVVEIWILEKR